VTKDFEVDTITLESAIPKLEALQAFVEKWIVHVLKEIPSISPEPTKAFGGFPAAVALANTHEDVRMAAARRYAELAQDLGRTVEATRKIIETYGTHEERSRASAQDVRGVLESVAHDAVAPSGVALPGPPRGESGNAVASLVASHGGQPMPDPSLTAGRAQPPATADGPTTLGGVLTPGGGS
jgi:hypothetical protein